MNTLLCLLVYFFATYVKVSDSVACGNVGNEQTCESTAGCVWATSYCACGSDVQMDIVFALDASGSIGSSDYQIELNWVDGVIEAGLTDDSRVSFIQFSTNANTKLNLNNGYTTQQLRNFVYSSALSYTGGYTNTVEALQYTMNQFDTYSNDGISKVLILITDGNPYLPGNGNVDVCAEVPDLRARDITVIIIGVGSGLTWTKVDCLTTDDSHQIAVSSYTDSALQQIILPILTTVTCPVTYDFVITEVQLDQYDNNGVDAGSRFVEIYNQGGSVDLSFIQLFGIFGGQIATTTTSLAQGQYLVLYDGGNGIDLPDCQDCDCTLGANNWCTTQATYIECCSSGCPCYFDGGSMNNKNWYQYFQDTSDNSYVDQVTYDDTTWPTIRDGYTYELIEKGYENDIGANWQESCNVRGTPGADPIKNCTFTCTTSQCQLNGAGSATCNNNKCVCNDPNYFATDTSCLLVPDPSDCIAYVQPKTQIGDDFDDIESIYFVWTAAAMTDAHEYNVSYWDSEGKSTYATTASRVYITTDYDKDRDIALPWGKIRTVVTSNGLRSYSDSIDCLLVTESPVASPTSAPTPSPTPKPTKEPTKKPTFEQPYIYVGGDICVTDRCDCYLKDLSCVGNDITKSFAASDDPQFITLKLWPRDFDRILTIKWNITYIGETDAEGVLLNESDTSVVRRRRILNGRRRLEEEEDISPNGGTITFPIDDTNSEQKINMTMTVYNKLNGLARYRLYKLMVFDCSTVGYICKAAYPNELSMIVDITGGDAFNSSKREKEMPDWVWYIIGCLLVFMLLLAWLVYRYWWRNKQAKGELDEVNDELDHAITQNEMGLDHDVGMGDIDMNPLATGVPNTERAPDVVAFEMNQRKLDANKTKVDAPTEKVVFRQEIGQNTGRKGGSKKHSNDLAQPLLG